MKISLDCQTKQSQKLKHYLIGLLSNKAITEMEKFFDWIVILKQRRPRKKTSIPGAIAPLKMDIFPPNKVYNVATDLRLTSGIINSIGTFWGKNCPKSSLVCKGVKIPGTWKKLYHTLIMAIMCKIFGMFTQCIYAHITIYI